MARRIATIVAATLSLATSGCFVFHDDYPDRSCASSSDCFRTQGEVCDMTTKTCTIPSDAAPEAPRPDARPVPDAGPEIDADITDAGDTDA